MNPYPCVEAYMHILGGLSEFVDHQDSKHGSGKDRAHSSRHSGQNKEFLVFLAIKLNFLGKPRADASTEAALYIVNNLG
jgi:hypothetical protein